MLAADTDGGLAPQSTTGPRPSLVSGTRAGKRRNADDNDEIRVTPKDVFDAWTTEQAACIARDCRRARVHLSDVVVMTLVDEMRHYLPLADHSRWARLDRGAVRLALQRLVVACTGVAQAVLQNLDTEVAPTTQTVSLRAETSSSSSSRDNILP